MESQLPLSIEELRPSAPVELLGRATEWDHLTRWERAEVGRALRRLGWTYSEIREVIPVPKGTLAGWCSEIRLSSEQIAGIKTRRYPGVREGLPVNTQRKRRLEIRQIRGEANVFARTRLSDSYWIAGTCLYWAEGSKTKPRVAVANSDPTLLRLFMGWFQAYHNGESAFVLAMHLHEGNEEAAAKRYWSSELRLEHPDFSKTFIKPKGTGHRKNRLPWGVCRVTARRSADAWHRTMAWIEVVGEAFATRGPSEVLANLPSGALAQFGRAADS